VLVNQPPDLGDVSRLDCIGGGLEERDLFLQANVIGRDGMRLRARDVRFDILSSDEIFSHEILFRRRCRVERGDRRGRSRAHGDRGRALK
jgi:hypothetical protein